MPLIESLIGAAPAAIGMGIGLLTEGHQDRRQLKQQKELTKIQQDAQNELVDYQAQRNFDYWQKTGVVGQKQELLKAGLNPALIYGMGGGTQGQSMGSSPTVAGATATQGGGGEIGMGINAMAQLANIDLMKSQARKNNVEANNMDEGGVQHENMVFDNIIKKYTGLEAKDYYEQISKPNRGIQSKTTADELEARQAIATTLYDLWLTGKLS